MANFDCFNGDADGICALIQLRRHQPLVSELITGVKRDTALLSRVKVQPDDQITALDISFDKNREAVYQHLASGASVFFCDHHYTGEISAHDKLDVLIDRSADICTSLLINQKIAGRFPLWAIVGASGDNLQNSASALAQQEGVNAKDFAALESLGIYINYNGYGGSLDDLHFHPARLYQELENFSNPLEFITENSAVFGKLESGYHGDMARAQQAESLYDNKKVSVITLPDEAWARRVSGVYGNHLANQSPQKAHAIVTQKASGHQVSVRAPLENKTGADEFCRLFPTGGGRAAAAGINALPVEQLDEMISRFSDFYGN